MIYTFRCLTCKRDFDIGIPLSEYDKKKNEQVCPDCGTTLERKIEWNGIATGSGDGWFGRSNGAKAI